MRIDEIPTHNAEFDEATIRRLTAEHQASERIDTEWVARQAKLGEFVPSLLNEIDRLRFLLREREATS